MAFSYRIEPRDGYVLVHQTGTFTTLSELRSLQRDIEAALDANGTRRVLFDNRDATQATADVRAHMWSWLTDSGVIVRAAIVAHSERVTRRADRTAKLNRTVLQGFQDLDEAEAWLLR